MTHQNGFLLQTKRLNPPDTATLRLAADSQTKPMARGTSKRPANIVETDD